MANWATAGIGAVLGTVGGLVLGGAIGSQVEKGKGPGPRIAGVGTGALLGMLAGAFAGAAIGSPSTAQAAPTPAPPSPLPAPAPLPAADPIITDAPSVDAAKTALGKWWAAVQANNPQALTQNYVPVLGANDPNFQPALAFFQQWVNQNATSQDFAAAGIPCLGGECHLPYSNGVLDQYTSQALKYATSTL